MKKKRADALIFLSSSFTGFHRKQLLEFATKSRLPTMCAPRWIDDGCVMAYGPKVPELYRRAAVFVDKILKGAKPADLPVEQPTKFELVINLKNREADRPEDSAECFGESGQGDSMMRFWILDFRFSVRGCLFLCALLSALCLPVEAQPQKVPRIGFLFPSVSNRSTFTQGLRDLGYIEGKNILIEWRSNEGQTDRNPALAAELVRLKVDVIVAAGSSEIQAAKEATSAIPIVMLRGGDPVGSGLISSLARPGGNVTGLAIPPRAERQALGAFERDLSKSLRRSGLCEFEKCRLSAGLERGRNSREANWRTASMAEHPKSCGYRACFQRGPKKSSRRCLVPCTRLESVFSPTQDSIFRIQEPPPRDIRKRARSGCRRPHVVWAERQ